MKFIRDSYDQGISNVFVYMNNTDSVTHGKPDAITDVINLDKLANPLPDPKLLDNV
jgi:hypothetical protein